MACPVDLDSGEIPVLMDLPDPLDPLDPLVSAGMGSMDDPELPDIGVILVEMEHPVLEERGETMVPRVPLQLASTTACPVHPVEMVTPDDPVPVVTLVTLVALVTEVCLVMLDLTERQENLVLMELPVCLVGLGIPVYKEMRPMVTLELPETGVNLVIQVLTEHLDLMEPLEPPVELVTVVTLVTLVLLENQLPEPLETMVLPELLEPRVLWVPPDGTGMRDDLVPRE